MHRVCETQLQDGSFFFLIARQALFVNQKHKANLDVWKTKDGPCVSFPPARPTAGRLQAEDRKKTEEEEEVGGEAEEEEGGSAFIVLTLWRTEKL